MLSELVLSSSEVRRAPCRRVVTGIRLRIACGRWLSEHLLWYHVRIMGLLGVFNLLLWSPLVELQ
eukprot:637363-Prorocentrum_minimum.AAC.1